MQKIHSNTTASLQGEIGQTAKNIYISWGWSLVAHETPTNIPNVTFMAQHSKDKQAHPDVRNVIHHNTFKIHLQYNKLTDTHTHKTLNTAA